MNHVTLPILPDLHFSAPDFHFSAADNIVKAEGRDKRGNAEK